MARLGEILSHLGRIKKSQFVVVALPAAAQGATVAAAAQCSVESRYPYVYLALRRTLYHKFFLKKYFPSLQESLSKIFRKYPDLFCFLIVLLNAALGGI